MPSATEETPKMKVAPTSQSLAKKSSLSSQPEKIRISASSPQNTLLMHEILFKGSQNSRKNSRGKEIELVVQ